MTRDDIIKMAKEAKLPYEYDTGRVVHLKELERFAELVAAAEREKVARWMMGCAAQMIYLPPYEQGETDD